MRVLLLAAAIGTTSLAKADIVEYLVNITVYNRTGQTANDLEWYLGGINPNSIIFAPHRPNPTSLAFGQSIVDNFNFGSRITYSQGSVPDGGYDHVGVYWLAPPDNPTSMSLNWTGDPNHANIGDCTPTGGHWETYDLNSPGFVIGPIVNPTNCVWLHIGTLGTAGPSPELGDLMVGGPQWNAATWSSPFEFCAGDTFTFNYLTAYPELAGQQAGYTMIIEQYADLGGTMGLLDAISFYEVDIPEPGSMALVGVGLATLALRFCRRRSR